MNSLLSGARAWAIQRLSALYMFGFVVFVLLRFPGGALHSYEMWRAWILSASVSVAVLLFFVALLLHTWNGVRDVILDYIKPLAVRYTLLALIGVSQITIGVWVMTIFLLK